MKKWFKKSKTIICILCFIYLFIQKQTLKVGIVFKMHYINTNMKNKTENGFYNKMETLKDDDDHNKTHSSDQMFLFPVAKCFKFVDLSF